MKLIKPSTIIFCLGARAFSCSAQGINTDFRDVDINVFLDAVSRTTNTQIIHVHLPG